MNDGNTTSTLTATDDNFDDEVLQSNVPVLVDFWADWCQPCKVVGPTIDALADEYAGRVKVAKLNVDENRLTAAHYGIRSIPTVALFSDGSIKRSYVGVQTKPQYQAGLEELLD